MGSDVKAARRKTLYVRFLCSMEGESVAVPALLSLPSYGPHRAYSPAAVLFSRTLEEAVTQTERRLFTRTSEQSLALVNVLFREYRARYTVTFSKRWTITLSKRCLSQFVAT